MHDGSNTTAKVLAQCTDHKSTVWRAAWNVTGTILATSGDDGCVRLWKGVNHIFISVSSISISSSSVSYFKLCLFNLTISVVYRKLYGKLEVHIHFER